VRLAAGDGHLVRNGSYPRWIPCVDECIRSTILRLKCQVCGTTYSLHPDFLVRAHHYSRELIGKWLAEWMSGTSFRSQRFLSEQAMACPAPEPQTSWSDLLDAPDTHLRPRYQLLHRWTSRFTLHATRVLPSLLLACIAVGCDVKRDVAPWLQQLFPRLPRRGSCLALALGMWAGLMAAGGDLGEAKPALWSLIGFLLARPLPVSHNVRRASGGAIRYDTLAHVGRDPT